MTYKLPFTTRTSPTILHRTCHRQCDRWLAELRADLAEDIAAFFGDNVGDDDPDPRKTVLCLDAVTPDDAASPYALTDHDIVAPDVPTLQGQSVLFIDPLNDDAASPYAGTQRMSCAVPSPAMRRRRERRARKGDTVPRWAKIG